jgi:hypothetical protein
MPIACRNKLRFGKQFCIAQCPVARPTAAFHTVRVLRAGDVPSADERTIDVAILDMNYGWPNLGHDSLVLAIMDAVCDILPGLEQNGLAVRVVSYEVRKSGMIPEGPRGRYALYLGTGGPGHLDPRGNDGRSPGSQGIMEDPSWEARLFALFDAIRGDDDAALLSVCHSFGVMCRWMDVARAVLRPPEKGGKSAGIQENVLTDEGARHPWFRQLAEELPDGRRLRVVDHRLFDLIPKPGPLPEGLLAIGHEARGVGGPPGEGLTMMEFARDRGGVMPRVFGVNHHPEIVDRARQMMLLKQKRERGEVTSEWTDERERIMSETHPDDSQDRFLHLTSDYTLLGPIRFYLYRQVRERAAALGVRVDVDEDRIAGSDGPAAAALETSPS